MATPPSPSAGRRPWRPHPALLVALAAAVLVEVPRAVLYWAGPPGHVFEGAVWGSWDALTYLAALGDGARGSWLWFDRLTGGGHGPYLLYTVYVWTGRPAAALGLTPERAYEALRWVALAAALGAGWLYVRASLEGGWRVLGYLFGLGAGGLGWLFLGRPGTPLGQVVPLDIADPNFSVVNSLQMAPHLALSAAGIAAFMWGVLETGEGRRRGLWAVPGLVFVATYHAFAVPPCLVAAGLLALWRRRPLQVLMVAVAGAGCAPVFGYWLWLRAEDPYVSSWPGYFPWEIENLPSFLAAHAVLLPFIAVGAWRALRERSPSGLLALAWALVALGMNVAPPLAGSALHRSMEGASLAWGVLAALGMPVVARRVRVYAVALAVVGLLVQSASVYIAGRADLNDYWPDPEYQAAVWLRDRDVRGGVLAGPRTAPVLIALTQLSPDPQARSLDWQSGTWLLDGLMAQPPAARSAWLLARGDRVVFWGAEESARYGAPPQGLRVLARFGPDAVLAP